MKDEKSNKDLELQSDLSALEMYVNHFIDRANTCNIKDRFIETIEEIGRLYEKPKIRHLQKELSDSAIRLNNITWDYNAAKRKFVEECDCKLKR